MRHHVDGKQFGRNTSHRLALFRNLANSVISQEQVVTTVTKAKEIRRVVDRIITCGKKDTLASRRIVFNRTRDRAVVTKVFSILADRYKSRAGGYTRVVKLSDTRRGDGAEMAIVELVDHPVLDRKKRQPPVEEGSAQPEGKQDDVSKKVDPFSKFRRLFRRKSE